MLILLLILLPALAFLAMYLKRRAARKREATQLAHNGGMPPPSDSEYHHHNFFGGRWRLLSRSNSHGKTVGNRTRDFGADGTLGRTGTAGKMSSVAGRQEMWGPHQGMAHTRGWGDYSYSSDDLQASSSRAFGAGEKATEATIAARAAISAGHGDENERSGTAGQKERRKRHSRSERVGKGKERGLGEEVWEDEAEGPVTGSPEKRRKRRSKSQRDRRETEVERDTESRFSL